MLFHYYHALCYHDTALIVSWATEGVSQVSWATEGVSQVVASIFVGILIFKVANYLWEACQLIPTY